MGRATFDYNATLKAPGFNRTPAFYWRGYGNYIFYKILGKACELLIFFSEVQLVAALPLVPSKLWLDG